MTNFHRNFKKNVPVIQQLHFLKIGWFMYYYYINFYIHYYSMIYMITWIDNIYVIHMSFIAYNEFLSQFFFDIQQVETMILLNIIV
jgi:hypothetical protein